MIWRRVGVLLPLSARLVVTRRLGTVAVAGCESVRHQERARWEIDRARGGADGLVHAESEVFVTVLAQAKQGVVFRNCRENYGLSNRAGVFFTLLGGAALQRACCARGREGCEFDRPRRHAHTQERQSLQRSVARRTF